MGIRLVEVVEHVRTHSKGLPTLDLARLNLRVGKPLSRYAAMLPDEPEVVEAAWRAAHEILAESK
jgi:hypothetical protein